MTPEKKALNAIWQENREIKQAISSVEKAIAEKQLNVSIPDVVDLVIPDTITVKDLYSEVFRALQSAVIHTDGEVKVANPIEIKNYPELQKIVGEVKADIQHPEALALMIAGELAKVLPKPKEYPASIDINKIADRVEIYGKALVKLEDNKPNNPVYVQLTNGKSVVDLKELFNVQVSAIAGGGGSDSGGGGLTDAELRAAPIQTTSPIYKLLLDDTSTTNVTYVGKAAIGSATSASVWQIQKIDETTGMSITWAGTALFTAKWDDRTTETYA